MTLDEAIFMLENLDSKIENALATEVAAEMKESIADQVMYSVYSYSAEPVFAGSRRWVNDGVADPNNIDADANGTTLTLTDRAGLQNLWGAGSQGSWSADVATLVQNGSEAFNQPYPRPFLDDAVKDAINEGRIDHALKTGLERNGVAVD